MSVCEFIELSQEFSAEELNRWIFTCSSSTFAEFSTATVEHKEDYFKGKHLRSIYFCP